MTKDKAVDSREEPSPIERLIDIADEIFDRAIKLDGIKLQKRDDEASRTIEETRDDAFGGCLRLWKVVLNLLPTSDLDQPRKKALEMDAYKVMSRCYHRLGNLDAAQRNIAHAIDAGYSDGFISLGAICLDQRKYEEAEAAFRTAIKKEVHVTRAHAGLGELYFAMGTEKLKKDPKHTAYFLKAEEEFITAGKDRFTEGFDRAMDLFETIGWRDRALSIGERAAKFYSEHRGSYGEKLRVLNQRIRKLTGEERHDKMVEGVGRKLSEVLGGKK